MLEKEFEMYTKFYNKQMNIITISMVHSLNRMESFRMTSKTMKNKSLDFWRKKKLNS